MGFKKGIEKLDCPYHKYVGDEVYCNISRRWFPKWEGWEMIDNDEAAPQIRDAAERFFRHFFWLKLKGDSIHDGLISEMLFVFAVKAGKKVVIKKLQRVLGVKVDGLVGNVTVQKLNGARPDTFIFQFLLEMLDFYSKVVDDPEGRELVLSYYYEKIKEHNGS